VANTKIPAPTSIGADEIGNFLNEDSDFSFEMQVLHLLNKEGLRCQHGGTYHDPKTEKIREFDIRAQQSRGFIRVLWAIECKNVREGSPIVAHLVRRSREEAFHDAIVGKDVEVQSQGYSDIVFEPTYSGNAGRIVRLTQAATCYSAHDLVAKSVDQITRDGSGKIRSSDGQFFEKSSQALNSAYDLINGALESPATTVAYFVFPVLVVPDGRLWAVEYKDDGTKLDLQKVSGFSRYMALDWKTEVESSHANFTISHLEVVEFSELKILMNRFNDMYLSLLWQYALMSKGRS
jgi:hypothetical protein